MGSITFLCLLTTPSTGFLIPRHLNPVKNLSSPWLQCGAHRRTIKRHLQSSSCVGILKDPHSPGFLLDHPAVTDCSGGLAQGKENQILFSLLAFPRGVLLQLCSKMSFTRTLRICRAEKNPFGGGGWRNTSGMGEISNSWRLHQFLMALCFWREGIDGAPVADEEFQGYFSVWAWQMCQPVKAGCVCGCCSNNSQ